MKSSSNDKRSAQTITVRHLVDLVLEEIYSCDKACGCNHCHIELLSRYDVTDAGAVLR